MIVLDTHTLVWAVQDDPQLGPEARLRLDNETGDAGVWVSAFSIWEVALLAKRARIDLEMPTERWVRGVLALPGIRLAPLDPEIAMDSVALPGRMHKDPADRIIVATARHHDVPLMTADEAILTYGKDGHVRTIDAGR